MHPDTTGAPIPSPASSRASWQTRLPFFYGWIIVASMFVVLGVGYGVYYSFSVFYVAILEEFGWSHGAAAGVFSLHVFMVGIGGAWAGKLIDRFGPSVIVPTGAVLLAAGLVASSQVTELWQYYVSFGLLAGFGLAMCGWAPAVTVVSAWFSSKRGLAIGIAAAGMGLGTVAFVPLSQQIISAAGWRTAYQVLAVLSLLSAPQAGILLVGRPDKFGLKPDGVGSAGKHGTAGPKRRLVVVDEKWAAFPWTISTALRTRRFWFMALSTLLMTLTNQMLWAHGAAYMVDAGYEKMLAAYIIGLAGLISMAGKITWGEVCDRFGRERTFTAGVSTMLCAIAVLVVLGHVSFVPLLGLYAVLFAFGYAINAPLSPASAGDLFGGRNFGGIFGVINIGIGIGGAFGAWVAGFVFDVTGSYLVALATAAASCSLSAVCLWLAAPRKVRRVVRQ